MTDASSKRKRAGARKRRRRRRPRWLVLVAAAVLTSSTVVAALAVWATRPGPSTGKAAIVRWPEGGDAGQGAQGLFDQALLSSPLAFRALLLVTSPFIDVQPGAHLLTDDASPAELLRRLARLSSRARTKVLIPEGFDVFQVAARLEEKRICSSSAFLDAQKDPQLLLSLGVPAKSAEGYLFPATYEWLLDTRPPEILGALVRETRRRFGALRTKHAGAMTRLAEDHDYGEHEILTLASIVEKEAAAAAEQPLVASVFFNRLTDPAFRPARMLQSDPTAAYGCRVDPSLASCAGSSSPVTPAMLRDASNPYNTYRHPGLPPGPIANPGLGALRAVLAPSETDFLFFFANGNGGHTFSRTFADHEAAIAPRRAAPRIPALGPRR